MKHPWESQDHYCRIRCKCQCGYYLARERDGWSGYAAEQPTPQLAPRRVVDDVIIEGPES